MKKYKTLIVYNIIALILIFTSFIGGWFLIYYPNETLISEIPTEDWFVLVGILFGIFIFSIVFALLFWKKISFWNKTFNINLTFNIILLGYITFYSISNYITDKQQIEYLEKQYTQQALDDIKNNEIDYTYSFVADAYDELDTISEEKISILDSVYSKYGLKFRILGLLTNDHIILNHEIAKEKYKQIIKNHLDKRNGKNWRQKLRKELDNIEKSPVE